MKIQYIYIYIYHMSWPVKREIKQWNEDRFFFSRLANETEHRRKSDESDKPEPKKKSV